MPPPSPQHFPPRFSQPPPPLQSSAILNYANDSRGPPPPHKRPGSSMSISSMLGSEPEKPRDPFFDHKTPARQTFTNGPSMSLGAVMSPPQYPPRSTEYSYKPRSHTPDRLAEPSSATRYRSSSGSLMQRPGPFYEPPSNFENRTQPPRYPEQGPSPRVGARDEAAERARRTSISGILQRPESDPHLSAYDGASTQNGSSFGRPNSSNGDIFGINKTVAASDRAPSLSGSYDTRPPPFSHLIRPATQAPTSLPKETTQPQERRDVKSLSPELRRVQPTGNEPRSLASILNLASENAPAARNMMRQDSLQSQSDRSAFGDRYRPRAFSPFAGSVASQTMSVTSVPPEEQARKGSDEISQHRQLLGLAAESKRGRYSPVPQAVQGAQAQTPVLDAGIKSEHGRVFAGLGGGLGSSSGPSSSRPGLAAGPFKASEGDAHLSEENLMKISRSSSGVPKRGHKYDDELRAESDVGAGKKTGRGNKRSKYAHSYRLDLDDTPRRNTPLSGMNPMKRTGTPTNATSNPQQVHHQYHLQRQTSAIDSAPLFKPKKTIRISSIIASAKRLPRRHVGNFKYDPEVDQADISKPGYDKFDISIRPNLLPSFTQADKVNCTYTVRVPKLWLQERERRLICKEAYLWGSGIYTDDSDVVAAAMHSGFMKAVGPEGVDQQLLDRVVNEQNPRIEGMANIPEKPVEPEIGKDAVVTLLVLPTLERYPGTARFGIGSRLWPESATKTEHDGVSFAVLKVDYVSGGVEARRMGRTGVSKRARIKQELEARRRGETLRIEMVEKMKKRRQEQKKQARKGPTSAPKVTMESKKVAKAQLQEPKKDVPALDVGQAPGEWLRQLEVSAVE